MDEPWVILRALGGLALAGLLIFVLARTVRRWSPAQSSGLVRVVDSAALSPATRSGPGARLVVVDVGTERFTLGVSSSQVQVLSTGQAPQQPEPDPELFDQALAGAKPPAGRAHGSPLSPSTWKQAIAALRAGPVGKP